MKTLKPIILPIISALLFACSKESKIETLGESYLASLKSQDPSSFIALFNLKGYSPEKRESVEQSLRDQFSDMAPKIYKDITIETGKWNNEYNQACKDAIQDHGMPSYFIHLRATRPDGGTVGSFEPVWITDGDLVMYRSYNNTEQGAAANP